MAERPIGANTRKKLINNEPFAYAHLVKFERPSSTLKNGNYSTDAKRYAYFTDASHNLSFDDQSNNTAGSNNGSQTYIAGKLIDVGTYSETTSPRATNMKLSLSGNHLGTSVSVTGDFASAAFTVDSLVHDDRDATDLIDFGFREGDKIKITKNIILEQKEEELGDDGLKQGHYDFNIPEEEVKNFLISQNETISNYTLNVIKENVYNSAFDDYIFVSEIKNIIEKKESLNSFATLTEIKEVLNKYNLEEVKNAFVDIKNIITNSSSDNILNNSIVENIDSYVNNLSNITSELVAKTLIENKNYSELKNISVLNQINNSNLSQQFNTAVNNITEQLNATTNVEQILNTINTELNNLSVNQSLNENTIVNENSEFINEIYNSVKNNSQEENKNYVNNLKQQFLNETLSTAENIFSNQNIKIENISNVLKTLNVNNFNSSNVNQLKNVIQGNIIANNYEINENNQLNYFANYLNNLAFKVDLIESSTTINNFEEINILARETALKYTTEFSEVKNEIKILNTLRNEIENIENYNELKQVINNFENKINQVKLEQINFIANTLIENNEYKSFVKENKEDFFLRLIACIDI